MPLCCVVASSVPDPYQTSQLVQAASPVRQDGSPMSISSARLRVCGCQGYVCARVLGVCVWAWAGGQVWRVRRARVWLETNRRAQRAYEGKRTGLISNVPDGAASVFLTGKGGRVGCVRISNVVCVCVCLCVGVAKENEPAGSE